MNEHPSDDQLAALRAAGYMFVTSSRGLLAGRGEQPIVHWREAFERLADDHHAGEEN